MDEYERALLEKLVANVEVLRSAVALLICAGLSDDALRAYRGELPSPELLSKVVYGLIMRRRDPGVLHLRI